MRPDPRFVGLPKSFWAYVRSISEEVGYTERLTKKIKVPSEKEIEVALAQLSLSAAELRTSAGKPTKLARHLADYFRYRARALNRIVEPLLMNVEEAESLFGKVRASLRSSTPIPMNKQKGKKRKPAFLTGLVNMLVDAHRGEFPCDLDPRQLTSVTKDGFPVRTLARRVDGAFPSAINPVALWEIKEYYHTTTFGSRVADGVYETLLDGMELEELRQSEGIHVKHYLILDDRFTWWECGRSYLCRVIDMLHMGYVDEVLFGRETLKRLPKLVKGWVREVRRRSPQK
jgi:hypothetical protein